MASKPPRLLFNQGERASADIAYRLAAQGEVIAVKEAHQRDERELVAAEMREMGTKVELERALADVATLQRHYPQRRPSFWQ